MAPAAAKKRTGKAPKLHEKCAVLPPSTKIVDSAKKEYVVQKEIGEGGFGRIYEGRAVSSGNAVAVKMEPHGNGPLFTEIHVFQRLFKEPALLEWQKQNKVDYLGLPVYIGSGTFEHNGEQLRFLVMPKYNFCAEEIFKKAGMLTLANALNLAKCVLTAYDYLHSQDYVHADVKASNLLLNDRKNLAKSCLVDYGLAKKLTLPVKEVANKKNAHNGTLFYTSRDAHRGCAPSFRGDLEILAHNLFHWLAGKLPWMAFEQDPEKVYAEKENVVDNPKPVVSKSLEGPSADVVIRLYGIVKNMEYGDRIDFDAVNQLFDTALASAKSPARGTKRAPSKSVGRSPRKNAPVDEEDEPSTSSSHALTPIPNGSAAAKRRVTASDVADCSPDTLSKLHKTIPGTRNMKSVPKGAGEKALRKMGGKK
ncbi:Protein kinase domain containing protein [Aphelenchoides avenae]|nr:Protein kinase domain containing protein [Aphelenchus avenae]